MAQAHARSGEVVALRPLGSAIGAARTTAILKSSQLEIIRVVLQAGQSMREHQAPGEITVMVIEGELEFTTPAATHTLAAGDWLHLAAREPHALHAKADTSLLLTMCLLPSAL